MPSDDLDPMRTFRESLAAQQSALKAVRQFTDITKVARDILAVENSLQVFDQWRRLTGASDLQRSLQAVSAFNQPLIGWSNAITAISMVTPDTSVLRMALAIPTAELRSLTNVVDDLDDAAKRSLADLATAVAEEDESDAPSLLSDWLGWLPSTAQTRLLILMLVALNTLIEYADVETGIEPPAHLTTLIYALAAVATCLNEYVARKQ